MVWDPIYNNGVYILEKFKEEQQDGYYNTIIEIPSHLSALTSLGLNFKRYLDYRHFAKHFITNFLYLFLHIVFL